MPVRRCGACHTGGDEVLDPLLLEEVVEQKNRYGADFLSPHRASPKVLVVFRRLSAGGRGIKEISSILHEVPPYGETVRHKAGFRLFAQTPWFVAGFKYHH
jgi:hypothetical protein